MTEPNRRCLRVEELNAREAALQKEILYIRKEREELYKNLRKPSTNSSSEFINNWIADLPHYFWQPAYQLNKLFAASTPCQAAGQAKPDLFDWATKSKIKDFILNIGSGLGIACLFLQAIFLLF